mgnify:FL=1
MNEDLYLKLFACIDGGNEYWSQEVKANGAELVFSGIEAGFYSHHTSSIKIKERLANFDLNLTRSDIQNSGAKFICPLSENWPKGLNV